MELPTGRTGGGLQSEIIGGNGGTGRQHGGRAGPIMGQEQHRTPGTGSRAAGNAPTAGGRGGRRSAAAQAKQREQEPVFRAGAPRDNRPRRRGEGQRGRTEGPSPYRIRKGPICPRTAAERAGEPSCWVGQNIRPEASCSRAQGPARPGRERSAAGAGGRRTEPGEGINSRKQVEPEETPLNGDAERRRSRSGAKSL